MPVRIRAIAATSLAAAVVLLVGCGGGDKTPPGQLERLGAPEGQLDLVALPGYIEDGSKDPSLDWVTAFEKVTGCQVSSATASSPAEVTSLIRTGRYDGVSARGDVGLGLVSEGLVSPVNTGLIPNYAGLFPAVKQLPANTVGDAHYGVPIGRFANLLLWRTDEVDMPRTHLFASTSSVLFDPALSSQYRGRVTAYDNPMSIADAALYLRDTDPSLGIDNVYELDPEQFAAVIALLRRQRPNVGSYWGGSGQNVRAFDTGASILGPAWQESINRILRAQLKVKADVPEEGGTGISDSWMISSRARHPNCMYLWMNYMSGAGPNAALAEHSGQAPASEHACDETSKASFCDTYRAADESVFRKVHFWATPMRDCGDSRGDVCEDYAAWARAWSEVKRG